MLLIHVAPLPLVMAGLIVWHVLLVRKHGVVPPIPLPTAPGAAREQDEQERVER